MLPNLEGLYSIAYWVGRMIEGFEISDETLAVDLIKEVGPLPGTYLDKEHAREWWRSQQSIIITMICYNRSDACLQWYLNEAIQYR